MVAAGYLADECQRTQRLPYNIELRQRILELAQRHTSYDAGMIYLNLQQKQWMINYKRVELL